MQVRTLVLAALLSVGAMALPSSAAVLAYDSFNYASLSNSTAAGGTGFTGNWTVQNGGGGGASDTIVAGLTYPSLPTANSAATSGNAVRSIESLSSSISSGTVWVSALIKGSGNSGGDAAGLVLAGSTNNVFAGFDGGFSGTDTLLGLGVASAGTAWNNAITGFTSGGAFSNTATHLLVMKLDLTAGTVSLYVDPTAGQPTAPAATVTSNITVGTFTGVGFQSINPNVTADEFRVGQSFGDVVGVAVPEPTTLGLLAVGAMGAFHRRRKV